MAKLFKVVIISIKQDSSSFLWSLVAFKILSYSSDISLLINQEKHK